MLVGFLGVFHGLPGQLAPAQVISFLVMRRGGTVRMGGKFVEFGGSSMGIARHTLPHLHFSSPRQVGDLPHWTHFGADEWS